MQAGQKSTAHRRFQGTVVKAHLSKTITVRVDRFFRHTRLHRVVRRQRKFLTHDESGIAREGDEVLVEETRPLSKRKRWRVVEIVSRAPELSSEDEDSERLNDESLLTK